MSTGGFDEPDGESGSQQAPAPQAPPRKGVNASEAAVVWAVAEHGGSTDLLEGAEPGPAAGVRELVEGVESMGEEQRREAAEAWGHEDRIADNPRERIAQWSESKLSRFLAGLSDPWQQLVRSWMSGGRAFPWLDSEEMVAGVSGLIEREVEDQDHGVRPELRTDAPHTFDALLEMSPAEFDAFLPRFGTYQIAELLRGRNRRRLARVMRQLPEGQRQLLIDCLNRERELERVERVRIREVFVTFSKYYDDFQQRITQLGLYSVACASGYRYRDRIAWLAERVGAKRERRLRRYYRLTAASTRRGVGKHFRSSMTELMEWLDERREADAESGGEDSDE